jgi:hypothetical protein
MKLEEKRKEKEREKSVRSENNHVSDPDFVNDFVVANFPPENSVEKLDRKSVIFSYSQNC